jgi:hypothetical protein
MPYLHRAKAFAALRPWKRAFIVVLRVTGCPKTACKAGNVSMVVTLRYKERDEEFGALWNDALEPQNASVQLRREEVSYW